MRIDAVKHKALRAALCAARHVTGDSVSCTQPRFVAYSAKSPKGKAAQMAGCLRLCVLAAGAVDSQSLTLTASPSAGRA